jgi:hypothetical protein
MVPSSILSQMKPAHTITLDFFKPILILSSRYMHTDFKLYFTFTVLALNCGRILQLHVTVHHFHLDLITQTIFGEAHADIKYWKQSTMSWYTFLDSEGLNPVRFNTSHTQAFISSSTIRAETFLSRRRQELTSILWNPVVYYRVHKSPPLVPIHLTKSKFPSPLSYLYLLTYLRSWALLEELSIVQPLRHPPAFHGTRRFNTVFTRGLHWSLSWAISIQSTPSHPISLPFSVIWIIYFKFTFIIIKMPVTVAERSKARWELWSCVRIPIRVRMFGVCLCVPFLCLCCPVFR